jgi:hypothetical protein
MSEITSSGTGAHAGTADEQALAALRWGWGEAYRTGRDAARGWWAARRDGKGGHITTSDSAELWQAIVDDYALRPVPRDLSQRSGNQP